MNVYDTVTADSLEAGDKILVGNDPIEVSSVVDDGSILIKGYSHLDGDNVTIILTADARVDLWMV